MMLLQLHAYKLQRGWYLVKWVNKKQ